MGVVEYVRTYIHTYPNFSHNQIERKKVLYIRICGLYIRMYISTYMWTVHTYVRTYVQWLRLTYVHTYICRAGVKYLHIQQMCYAYIHTYVIMFSVHMCSQWVCYVRTYIRISQSVLVKCTAGSLLYSRERGNGSISAKG